MPGRYIAIASLIGAALGSAWLTLYAWHRRQVSGGGYFAACMGAVTVWAVTTLATHLAATLPAKLFWTNLQYAGITLIPPTWLLFALAYAGREDRITPRLLALFSLYPILVQAAVWTDPYHHLFYGPVWLDEGGAFPTLAIGFGPFFWVHMLYAYALLLTGFYFLFRARRDAPQVYRRQSLFLMIALLVPWVANIATVFGAEVLSHFDLTLFAFLVGGAAIARGLLRHGLFDLVPVAHHAVTRNLRDGIIVLDVHGRLVNLNPAAEAMLDLASDADAGRVLAELLPDYADVIARCMESEGGSDEVVVGEGAAQTILEVRSTVLRDRRDQIIGHLVSLHDVTERRRSQVALGRYTERLRILHEIDQAILAAKSPQMIADAALEQIHHLVPSQRASVVARDTENQPRLLAIRSPGRLHSHETPWRDLLATATREHPAQPRTRALTGDPEEPPEFRRLYDEGVRSTLVVPLIVQGRQVGTLNLEATAPDAFTAEDVDVAAQVATSLAVALENARLYEAAQQELAERIAAEVALRESEAALRQKAEDLSARNAELDAFAHTVAHDLKMPLSLLIGYTSFIEAGEVDDDPAQLAWCVEAIGQSARKMSSIIDELLLLASVRKGGDVKLKPVDMHAVVSDVLIRFADLIEQRGASITVPRTWPAAWGHAPWIEEVWANYLSNALKYGGTPPQIALGACVLESDDGAPPLVRFWVHDNGDGLSGEQQARLFVPFERLDAVRAKGYGLGLSIVQWIVEKLGGSAGVESTGEPGSGSTFYFTLPQVEHPS